MDASPLYPFIFSVILELPKAYLGHNESGLADVSSCILFFAIRSFPSLWMGLTQHPPMWALHLLRIIHGGWRRYHAVQPCLLDERCRINRYMSKAYIEEFVYWIRRWTDLCSMWSGTQHVAHTILWRQESCRTTMLARGACLNHWVPHIPLCTLVYTGHRCSKNYWRGGYQTWQGHARMKARNGQLCHGGLDW